MAIYTESEICEYQGGCKRSAKYALFRLLPGGGKKWGQYCRMHEEEIVRENGELKKEFPTLVFQEIH